MYPVLLTLRVRRSESCLPLAEREEYTYQRNGLPKTLLDGEKGLASA